MAVEKILSCCFNVIPTHVHLSPRKSKGEGSQIVYARIMNDDDDDKKNNYNSNSYNNNNNLTFRLHTHDPLHLVQASQATVMIRKR